MKILFQPALRAVEKVDQPDQPKTVFSLLEHKKPQPETVDPIRTQPNCVISGTGTAIYRLFPQFSIVPGGLMFALLPYCIFLLLSLAITHLSGVKVYGKEIKVTSSKHNSVSMPKEGDVSNTRVFDHPYVANFKAIYVVCTDS